ncbi:MAG: hypothetical protein JXC32_06620 [Anaerolineae bacterium]|nr:hypothetical protein [Anaerolineae bacterium]
MPALGAGQAAKAAYATMTQWASGWASDAAVVNCTTSCTRNDGGSDAWQFQVHSADLGRIAAARVQGSEVVVLRESAALFKQRPLPLDAWKLDSSQAVQVWWNNGGQTAWNQPDTEALHVRLGLNTDSRLTWQFTVTYGADDALGFWEISAQDGVLLSQNAGVANE